MDKLQKILEGIRVKKKYSKELRDPLLWLFGEWFGERCNDNCLNMANYVSEYHPEINVFWAAKRQCDCKGLNPKIHIVYFGTRNALNTYRKAGVVFMNQGFGDFSISGFNYFGNALTINLWHGVMWKRIGHDGSRRNNFLYRIYTKMNDFAFGADKYVATSEEYAKVCESAFGAKKAQIIRVGYPRNALFYDEDSIVNARKSILLQLKEETGMPFDDNVKIITYMPTFRDKKDDTFSFESFSEYSELSDVLIKLNAIILQKAHFINQKRNQKNDTEYNDRVFEFNNVDAQILLAATDLLVTDYSSCFFDFLLLDRPIIHFIYDYNYYAVKDRGLYYKYQDVCCGDVVFDKESLIKSIQMNLDLPNKDKSLRTSRLKKYMNYESPRSCEIIFDYITDGFSSGKIRGTR